MRFQILDIWRTASFEGHLPLEIKMSAPRCIRLAIRACRPVKISHSTAQSSRRSFASTSSFRDATRKDVDIMAGFPEVPGSTESSQPSSPDEIPTETSTVKPAAKARSKKGITVELADQRGSSGDSNNTSDKSLAGRELVVGNLPSGSSAANKRTRLEELFSAYGVESVQIERGSPTKVILRSAEDAQKAISALSGVSFSSRKSSSQESQQAGRQPGRTQSTAEGSNAPPIQATITSESQQAIKQSTTPSTRLETSAIEPQNIQRLEAIIPDPDSEQAALIETEVVNKAESSISTSDRVSRIPLNVLAAYHKPLKIDAHLGIRVASLQLRSYSVRNLELMCDFALRAAYFLGLSASGPVPLPKRIERWTMPRSNFAHKKSQENFERITRRRLIQISDGHQDVVQIWLAYLRKHQFYGVGMKANVWEFEGMDVAASMDAKFHEVEKQLDEKLALFGWSKQVAGDQNLAEQLRNMGPGQQVGVPMMHVRERSRSKSRL